MLPIVDKPTIQYVVEEAVAAGIEDILIITGRNKRAIEDHFDYCVELEHTLEKKGKKGGPLHYPGHIRDGRYFLCAPEGALGPGTCHRLCPQIYRQRTFCRAPAVGQLIGPQSLKPLDAKPDYEPLREELTQFIATLPGNYGIYFKDLESGEEFGINETEPFPPASTIKLPVVLYLYEQIAEGKLNWNDRCATIKTPIIRGELVICNMWHAMEIPIPCACLATISIVLSDNIAHNMLVRHLGYDNVMNFINKLGPNTTAPLAVPPLHQRIWERF